MDATGAEIKDVIEAPTEEEAQATIRQMGYFVTKITAKKARKKADLLRGYIQVSQRVHPQFTNPPGYAPIIDNVKALQRGQRTGCVGAHYQVMMKDGRRFAPIQATYEDLAEAGILFCGTPDQVFNQIKSFYEDLGGFGHLMIMGQAGWLSHEDTCANLTMFAREVYPRLKALPVPELPEAILQGRQSAIA